MTITVRDAVSDQDLSAARQLTEAYLLSLPISVDFQDIDGELRDFPARFKRVLIAETEARGIVGTVALKDLSGLGAGLCEMKRLFVAPEGRSLGTGKALVNAVMRIAAEEGYTRMVLDTLERLESAIRLYERAGFVRTDAYYNNPTEDVIYMVRDL